VPRLREQPTVFFAKRIAQAFPGVRGIQWFEDKGAIKTRLEKLFAKPLKFADASPIWWWRGHSCMHIEEFEYQTNGVFLMDFYELLVSRVAAVVPRSYNRSFVYVELAAMEPTGLYPGTAERIAEVKEGKSDPFPYYWEEYSLVDGQYLVTRGELDDGAAMIGGELQDIRGRNEVRSRYLTPFNFVIAPQGNPIEQPGNGRDCRAGNERDVEGEGLPPAADGNCPSGSTWATLRRIVRSKHCLQKVAANDRSWPDSDLSGMSAARSLWGKADIEQAARHPNL
jgi:hypothetical protein